jgi:Flp pilus assembly protein TadD
VQISAWALGFFFEWDWRAALQAISRAIEIEPDHVLARVFKGVLLGSSGSSDEAAAEFAKARELDPLSAYVVSCAGMASLMGGQANRAIAEFHEALELDRENVQALSSLGMAHARERDFGEAVSWFERTVDVTANMPIWQAGLGWALAEMGRAEEARAVLAGLLERAESEYVSPLYISWVHSGLGETENAFGWVAKALEEKNPYLTFWRMPVFDGLRADPRFDDLLRRAGLR